jgi:hypothetical protein
MVLYPNICSINQGTNCGIGKRRQQDLHQSKRRDVALSAVAGRGGNEADAAMG